VTRHEVHSTNTHTLQNAGRWNQTKHNVLQGIGSRRNHRVTCVEDRTTWWQTHSL